MVCSSEKLFLPVFRDKRRVLRPWFNSQRLILVSPRLQRPLYPGKKGDFPR